ILQHARRPNNESAIEAQQKIENPRFLRFQYAGARGTSRNAARFYALNRRTQAVEVEIIERDAGGRKIERRIELLRSPDQQVQFGDTGGGDLRLNIRESFARGAQWLVNLNR